MYQDLSRIRKIGCTLHPCRVEDLVGCSTLLGGRTKGVFKDFGERRAKVFNFAHKLAELFELPARTSAGILTICCSMSFRASCVQGILRCKAAASNGFA